jgi:uncharacterized protein YeaO (DUF488 family)
MIFELPLDNIIQIFTFMKPKEILKISLTCKKIKEYINSDILWKEYFEYYYHELNDSKNYLESFKKMKNKTKLPILVGKLNFC